MSNQIPGSGCLMVGDKGQIFSPDDYGTQFYLKLSDEKEFTRGHRSPGREGHPPNHPAQHLRPAAAGCGSPGRRSEIAGDAANSNSNTASGAMPARGGGRRGGGRGGPPRLDAHHQEWIAACKGGKPGYSNFDIAAYLTEIMVLGCVAIRAGKKLEWDGPNMTAKNAPEAAQFVHPEFRKGWEI